MEWWWSIIQTVEISLQATKQEFLRNHGSAAVVRVWGRLMVSLEGGEVVERLTAENRRLQSKGKRNCRGIVANDVIWRSVFQQC